MLAAGVEVETEDRECGLATGARRALIERCPIRNSPVCRRIPRACAVTQTQAASFGATGTDQGPDHKRDQDTSRNNKSRCLSQCRPTEGRQESVDLPDLVAAADLGDRVRVHRLNPAAKTSNDNACQCDQQSDTSPQECSTCPRYPRPHGALEYRGRNDPSRPKCDGQADQGGPRQNAQDVQQRAIS